MAEKRHIPSLLPSQNHYLEIYSIDIEDWEYWPLSFCLMQPSPRRTGNSRGPCWGFP